MSKMSTVAQIRREQFKIDIARVKRFLFLTDEEFNSIFIDGEPDGTLNGRVEIQEDEFQVVIYRNGRSPEFFCLSDRKAEKLVNEAYHKIFPRRSRG